MLDRRATLILAAAAPVGLVLGAAAWTLAGGAGFAQTTIAEATAAFPAVSRAPRAATASSGARLAINAPLFMILGAKGAAGDPTIRLEGIARTPGRIAALLAIDAKPSAWLSLGETRDGVTLVEVLGSTVTVDTVLGTKDIRLGAASAIGAVGSPGPVLVQDAGPPPGYRMPPPPASAPAMPTSAPQ